MKTFVKQQWPILSVYLGILAALIVVVYVDFRFGAILLSLSVLLAFLLRLRLPDSAAGLTQDSQAQSRSNCAGNPWNIPFDFGSSRASRK
jgi:hypothetical protein